VEQNRSEKLLCAQPDKKLLSFCRTEVFIYVRDLPLVSVSQVNPIVTFRNHVEGVEGYVGRYKLMLWILFNAFAYFLVLAFF
jgi:hypothetical protein